MSVIELSNDDIKDLKDGFPIITEIDGKKCTIIGTEYFVMRKIMLFNNELEKLNDGDMVKLHIEGREIGIIGPNFELD